MRLRLLLAFCLLAAAPARASDDPFEGANRRVHAVNQMLHSHVLGPLATLYRTHTPASVREGIGNAAANLAEPVTAVSAALAGEFGQAGNAAARFAINTTLGLGGVREAAAPLGYPRASMTLGDTLCRWGVPSGPFLMLPVFGPSTLRDAGALLATSTALSQGIGSEAWLAIGATDQFHAYAEIHPIIERVASESLDPYATFRSAYLQRRAMACPGDGAGAED
ncbi:MAG: VacJ family lipoprotein [Pseudomonadota bacterium]